MSKTIKPYQDSDASKKSQVSEMFDKVSSNYDQLNRVITFGMDIRWRKNVRKIIAAIEPKRILDIATGTADMPILFSSIEQASIIGIDISQGMLDVGVKKVKANNLDDQISLELGDAENLRFDNNHFDAITVSYGIRNFENLEQGLSEILRVLKPGGKFVILETSVPKYFPMKQGYLFYTKFVMPKIGKAFSKDKKAYSYLSTSAINFPYGEALKAILTKVGFKDVEIKPQAQGISSIYVMSK